MTEKPDKVERWRLRAGGRNHLVLIEKPALSRSIQWYVDDEMVAEWKSSSDEVTLTPESSDDLGSVALRFRALGATRRVTWHDPETAALTVEIGAGGIDFEPEPGSAAALREQRIREHPVRHQVLHTLGAVAKVLAPILLGLLAVRVAVQIPWPNLPDVPLPDLPDVPLPDLPDIPWPDIPWPHWSLPDWDAPAWLERLAETAKYVFPILFAYGVARSETKRRREQDRLRAEPTATARDDDSGAPGAEPAGPEARDAYDVQRERRGQDQQ